MGNIVAVCISEKKGTAKQNVGTCRFIENWGLEKDAHAGSWHRQVSLLSYDEVEKFRQRGANVADGAFGENLLVKSRGDCGMAHRTQHKKMACDCAR